MAHKKERKVSLYNNDPPQWKASTHNRIGSCEKEGSHPGCSTPSGHSGMDPALNFLSEAFDPVKVLQCSLDEVCLPHPSIQACDNLHAYVSGNYYMQHISGMLMISCDIIKVIATHDTM